MRNVFSRALLLLAISACGDDDPSVVVDAAVDATTDATTDATIDAALDVCDGCASDEICVQHFDGTCGIRLHECVKRTVECPDNACSEDCEDTYCGEDGTFQCMTRPPCGTESPTAFTCYGA